MGLSWRALGLDHNFKLIEVRTSEMVYGKSIYGGEYKYIMSNQKHGKVADDHFVRSVQLYCKYMVTVVPFLL